MRRTTWHARRPAKGTARGQRPLVICLAAAVVLGNCAAGQARVVRLVVESREQFAGGAHFGTAGAYERITGRMHLEVDPRDEANRLIVDLHLAPRNERGQVEFWTDFFLLAPVDPAKGNRRLFYDVNNRGSKLALGAFNHQGGNNPKTVDDAGNGFLMRQGYSLLWCGWNGDVLPGADRLMIGLPTATDAGQPIFGRLYSEISVNEAAFSQPLAWGNTDPYGSLDQESALLTMRPDRAHPAVEIPKSEWAFARWHEGKVVPDPKHLFIKSGYRPGVLYEVVYSARDPRVTGLGFAAVRDVVSFFRHDRVDSAGAANPLHNAIERAYVFGISQSARFIHHFIHLGFDTDEAGRVVFDGALAHVGGGGKGDFNHRFAQTTRHGSQHEDNLYPSELFPFASVPHRDLDGTLGDTLAIARQRGFVPKIFFTETSTEYWCRAASLLHTEVDGSADLSHDPMVRIYFIAGAQHGVSSSSARGIFQNPVNVLDHRPVLRALLVALDRWVTTGAQPPASVVPRIDQHTLVSLEAWRERFPKIPGSAQPAACYAPLKLDFGPRWHEEGIADFVPPRAGPAYRTLVPQVDADGNELAGIRLPDVAVPLATYTGWNVRAAQAGAEKALGRWAGSYLAFPRDRQERERMGDPRLSVIERYPTRGDYIEKVVRSVLALRESGFLLDEDVVAIVKEAGTQDLWR
jgi:hypothetical protein